MHSFLIQLPLLIFLLFSSLSKNITAQSLLTSKQAKQIALDNNYNVQISQHSLGLIQNNTNLIKAGRKPTLFLSAGLNGNLSNSFTKPFVASERVDTWLAPSVSTSASASSQYLLWDAHSIDQRLKQNEAAVKQANLRLKATDQEIVFQVESIYFNIMELKEREALLEESIEISHKRKLRAQYAFEYGQANKLNLLNADVDLNRDSLDLIRFQQQLINLKRNLNLLLNRDINIAYTLEKETSPDATAVLSLEQYKTAALAYNLDILQAQEALNISSFDTAINDAALKPQVFANASYGVNYFNNSDVNLIDYSLNDGLKLGLSATWTIGNGGRTKTLNENVALNIKQQSLRLNQLKDRTVMNITNSWGNYQNALRLYALEQSNVATAVENFDRTEEQFKQGLINSITFRQAQLNLLNTKLSLATAKYDVILLVLDLKLLSGVI